MLGEQLLMSLKVIVLGTGTVFIALIALIYVIELINKILNLNEGQSNKENKHIVMDSSEFGNGEESPDAIDDPNQEHDDEEIVAVIAAAVAASLSYSTHDIIVRSIRRISSNTPAWNRAGRSQQIAGKL